MKNSIISGLIIGSLQVNFSTKLTDKERADEVKKYRSFYKKDNRGRKIKIELIKK